MKQMEEIDHILNRIQRVEAPAFLYTKVQARISALKEEKVSWLQAILVSAALASVLLLSIRVVKQERNASTQQGQFLTEATNQLY